MAISPAFLQGFHHVFEPLFDTILELQPHHGGGDIAGQTGVLLGVALERIARPLVQRPEHGEGAFGLLRLWSSF
jgi:hypothetical protein